jgi:hypothetical protein
MRRRLSQKERDEGMRKKKKEICRADSGRARTPCEKESPPRGMSRSVW